MSNNYQNLISDVLKIDTKRKDSLRVIRNSIAAGNKKDPIKQMRAYFDTHYSNQSGSLDNIRSNVFKDVPYTTLEFTIKEALMKEDFETAVELIELLD
jgi:hypothetical protein